MNFVCCFSTKGKSLKRAGIKGYRKSMEDNSGKASYTTSGWNEKRERGLPSKELKA